MNCSPVSKIFCFIQPQQNLVHVGYEDEEIKKVKKDNFCEYLFYLCEKKDEGHISIGGGTQEEVQNYCDLIRDYEFEKYEYTPILLINLLPPNFNPMRRK